MAIRLVVFENNDRKRLFFASHLNVTIIRDRIS